MALSRDRDGEEWVDLPASGRTGRIPALPLPQVTKRERALWNRLWKKPQAIMWERLGQEMEVALFVRRLAEAEEHGSATNLSTLVRQMSDSLGLTTPGLRSNRWRIVRADEPEKGRRNAAASSSRNRLKVVRDDDA